MQGCIIPEKFDEYDFPYIEMTKWFQAIKEADTVPYILIPQSGAHWSFSSVIAADSLFRFMGSLKNEKLGTLKVGPLRESSEQTKIGDYDLENTLNLWRTVSHKGEKLLDAEVTVISDSTTVKPNVLFVGNSYLFRMNYSSRSRTCSPTPTTGSITLPPIMANIML